MKWLKDVLLDIAVTILIVLATSGVLPWAQWIVFVYTPFMLAMKVLAFFSHGVTQFARQRQEKKEAPPSLFYHALYATNTALLALYAWWLTALQWALIWLFSYLIERREG